MKKIIALILIMISGINVFGQQASAGIKAGANFSSLSNVDAAKTLTGLTAGGFFVYSIVEHFGVSADVLYSGEGAKFSNQYSTASQVVNTETNLRLNYIRVPLLANVFFGQLGDRIRPKICLGPNFGFLMSVKNKTTVTTLEGNVLNEETTTVKDKNGYAGFDLSAIVGAGINYRMNDKTWLNLELKYNVGATDVNEVKPLYTTDAVKNKGLAIAAGIAFGL
jgi:outer membrane protein W